MEEISKRFEIIRLAIQLADKETIEIQAKKLREISLDDNLDEIISLLESRSYRQALFLMKSYAESLKDEFFEDEPQNKTTPNDNQPDKANPVANNNQSNLLNTPDTSGIKIITVDDLLNLSDKSKESIREYSNIVNETPTNALDGALDEENSDILNIAPPKYPNENRESSTYIEPMLDIDNRVPATNSNNNIPEPIYDYQPAPEFNIDDFKDDTPPPIREQKEEIAEDRDTLYEIDKEIEPKIENDKSTQFIQPPSDEIKDDLTPDSIEEKGSYISEDNESSYSNEIKEKERQKSTPLSDEDNVEYPPMPHIELKFRNMLNQYPAIEEVEYTPPEIYDMIDKISQEGYSEQDILDFLDKYTEYKKEGNKSFAAQVLLLAAATESKFAQFLLARELFSGEVLQKDHGEAFTQIKILAEKNFPEAICDLGQFYEYGIGIDKDKKMALILYEEAAEMGVERAKRHVERLKKSRGLFGLFKF